MSTSWIRLATGFARHPKGLAAGPTGRHLFIVGLCWCGEYDTDGRIPGNALVTLAGDAGIPIDECGQWADKLVDCGLWEREPDGWQVHDWGQWQTTTEEREVKLNGNKERQARWRERQRAARNQSSEDVTRYEPVSNGHVTAPESESESKEEAEESLSLLVPLGGPPSAAETDRSSRTTNMDQRITDTFRAWLKQQAISGPLQIPPTDRKRMEGYIQSSMRTIDQHWPALKALAQANPTTPPAELAALYRKPKP